MKTIEKFDTFLRNEMDSVEREAFEKELAVNHSLKKEFIKHKQLVNSIKRHERNKLKKHLLSLKPAKKNLNSHKLQIAFLLAAASVSIIVILLQLFYKAKPRIIAENKSGTYIERFYQTPANYYAPSQRNGINDSMLKEAFRFYDKNNFSKASVLFDQLLIERTDDINFQYYAASCYIANEQFQKAKKILEQIVDKENYFNTSIQWDLALLYLDTNEPQKAKDYLKQLSICDNQYKETALKILKQLN